MKPETQDGVSRATQGRPPSFRRPSFASEPCLRGRVLLFHLGLLLLAGCPQLLSDDFQFVERNPAPDAGGTGGAGAGGTAGTGAGGAGGSELSDPPDGGPPVPLVVASSPANGARGVLPDAEIVFTFSAPMNTSSVEAAYTSSQLPAAQVSFVWSDDDTVLRVQPAGALQVASGSDPAAVVAQEYAIDLAAGAQDRSGNALGATHVGFSVVRSITQPLSAVRNRDLTGNWRGDGSYGVTACERIDTTICMGDSISTGEPAYRGFVTFDLSTLPRDLLALSAAELSATVAVELGTPFVDLGALRFEHLTFSSIGDEAYAAPALSAPQSMSLAAAVGDRISSVVLTEVQGDWPARDQSQFRLSFEVDTNTDGAADLLAFDWASPQLTLTYSVP